MFGCVVVFHFVNLFALFTGKKIYITLTILISLNFQLSALLDTLQVAQHQLDTEVSERRQVVDGVLRIAALGVITNFLPGFLFAAHPGAVLDGQVVAVAAGHIVAQRFPTHCHLFGLDVHHFQLPWPVHGLWRDGQRERSVSIHQHNQLGNTKWQVEQDSFNKIKENY